MSSIKTLFARLGPGLLYAGAAIGVSHVVQSTKAGAMYGYVLLIAIFLAHIFKYPFFELGPRYAAVTGESLISGYRKLGKWSVGLVFILTFSTMFAIQAAVTVVTAGIALKITGLTWNPWVMSALLLLICAIILSIGHFNLLNNLIKVIMIILAVTTIVAAISSFFVNHDIVQENLKFFDWKSEKDTGFLIAFLGWMPAPLDIAIWHSLWTVASHRTKPRNEHSLKQSLFDFRVGYWGTAFLAFCFLLLGANVIYGTSTELSASGVVYAGQLIDLYTSSLGSWSYYIIAVAAFTTMFSTTLTCLDAMPRVLTEIVKEPTVHLEVEIKKRRKVHYAFMGLIMLGAIILLSVFISNMKQMVTLATTISFLTAPILAWLGIRVVKTQLKEQGWSKKTYAIAIIGVTFLALFSLYYIVTIV